MVVEGETYHMGGECIETTLESIHNALEGGDWSIEKSDELELSGDFWTMQVYEVGSGGTFLLGGAFSAKLERVRPALEAVAQRLGDRGIAFLIEASLYRRGPAKLTP